MPTDVPPIAVPQTAKVNWWTLTAWLIEYGYLDGDALEVVTARSMRSITLVPVPETGEHKGEKNHKGKKKDLAVADRDAGLAMIRFTMWVTARRAAPVVIDGTLTTLTAGETADITVTVPGA